MPNPIVELARVQKIYATKQVETHALHEVNLDIADGEYVCIAGPSGCGKSTLLSILGLLDRPSGGTYLFKGRSTDHLSAAQRTTLRNREIGFIFQSFNLIGSLTVYENVELPLVYRNVGAADRKQLVRKALERVDLAHRAQHMPDQLSGGQQQRVAVARAVSGAPLLLLADEPTGNLDSQNGDLVMALMRELNQAGTTVCMVTHDARYAMQATRTIRLFDGCLVSDAGWVANQPVHAV